MFNRKKIDELEIRVRRLESDVQWLKNELSGYTYSWNALLKKLGLKFVEKPASMELEDA